MTENISKQNIESIFPLTTVQQGLLFHSLSSAFDEGFLNFQCDLNGSVDSDTFEKAWNMAIERHSILRTTVHWENIPKPVQIVHKKKTIQLEQLDWSNESIAVIEKKWDELTHENRSNGVDFTKGALLQIKLVQFKADTYRLLWTNHHLLLDGWSSNIILKDVIICYETLLLNESPTLEAIPSHKSYLRWVSQKNVEEAQTFWSDYFKAYTKVQLLNDRFSGNKNESTTLEYNFTAQETDALKNFAKQTKVTLNTLIQGIWSLVLCRYFNSTDVLHGTTISGRTSDFPNMELLAGMYSKVHPIRNFIHYADEPLVDWFIENQKRQLKASTYEYLDFDDISKYLEGDLKMPFFDSLLIFENYPMIQTDHNTIKVSNFKSGVTSTYPITLAVLPGSELQLSLSVVENTDHNEKANWLLNTFVTIKKAIVSGEISSISQVFDQITNYAKHNESFPEVSNNRHSSEYIAPRNTTEEQIAEVWQDIFGIDAIGIHENFFSIGGKSLIAVKIFVKLSDKYGVKLPPTTLLEYPTIAEIAELLVDKTNDDTTMDFMVPLRTKGKKAPLFCVHAGGGHVFFYNHLPKYLHAERPVYAVQPSGIDGKNKLHSSIAEMTSDYLKEIKQIQPKGPYHILVYCFGTAVGIEMIRQLSKTNEKAHIIVMDTMALQEKVTADRLVMRTKNFINRFLDRPLASINTMVTDRVKRYLKPIWVGLFGSVHDKNLEALKQNLVTIYKKYEWYKFEGDIDLMLTEKASESLNDEIVTSWKKLTNGVVLLNVKGNHRTLFEEPDVKYVGEKLEESMKAYEEQ